MKVHGVKAIEGANFFSHQPVIRGVVNISAWQGKSTREMGDFNERLLATLPSLGGHYCSRGKEGGFLERLEEGTLPGHVLEHVAIELLSLAGEKTRYGKTRLLDEARQEYEVIYQYQCKEAAIEAFYMAEEVMNGLVKGTPVGIDGLIEKLKQTRAACMPGPSTQAILNACARREIPVMRLGGSLYQLGYGRFGRKIQAAMTDQTSCIGVDIAGDKQLARKIMREAAIPVPFGVVAHNEEEILDCFRQFHGSVVVKPCQGNHGKGVSLDLRSEEQVLAAFRLAEAYGNQVILEEYIEGKNYRLLVVGGKLVAAARRIPPHIVGDGKANIKELVEVENTNPLRGEGHEKVMTKISLDAVVVMDLYRQGLTLSSVPKKGQIIQLRQSANLSTGATAEDITEQVHPDNAQLAVYAARILNLDIAGVDINMEDISRSYREQNGKIIEVNAAPGLRMHLHPSSGRSRDVAEEFVEMIFPKGNGRIPLVSVTGTNGKTTTVRLISKILQKQNLTVGMTSTEGIYINDRRFVEGDSSGPQSAQVVLRHPDIQVAVLETARGGILRGGLGYDYADVAIITNITEDHLGPYGIDDLQELTKVKSLVAERVKRHSYVVLNAEDQQVASLSKKTKGRVILFSTKLKDRVICRHLALGGTAVVVDRNRVLICRGIHSEFVCHLSKIPITWGGKARHNVQNVLAGVAASWALGYQPSQIRKAIQGFGEDVQDNQGRLEYYESQGVRVILDYGHNQAGIKEIVRTLKSLRRRKSPKKGKMIACIGLPGDRDDEAVKKLSQEAARGFDVLYIKEDQDLRGRASGEIAGLIYQHALQTGKKPGDCKIVLGEEEAFAQALKEAQAGDLVVVFYEKAEPLRQILAQRGLAKESEPSEQEYDRLLQLSLEVGS